jgi:hypothetical protein
MRVFISWSGGRSKQVAEALNRWLPRVINAVDPWISTRMEKGTRSAEEIASALETSFGIVCLTRDNQHEAWVQFEAGALSKTKGARVWTFLLDLTPSDVRPPLSQFQHTLANEEDVRKLVGAINLAVGEQREKAITEAMLDEQFRDLWPRLKADLSNVSSTDVESGQPVRQERELLEEMLSILRTVARAPIMTREPVRAMGSVQSSADLESRTGEEMAAVRRWLLTENPGAAGVDDDKSLLSDFRVVRADGSVLAVYVSSVLRVRNTAMRAIDRVYRLYYAKSTQAISDYLICMVGTKDNVSAALEMLAGRKGQGPPMPISGGVIEGGEFVPIAKGVF